MEQSVPLLPSSNGSISFNKATVNVNVGGRRARLPSDLVSRRLESSRLAVFCQKSHVERLTDCDAFFESTSEYYFERNPVIFEYVIDYYITGKLHRPLEICPIRLRYELDYWRIPIHFLSSCCQLEENNNMTSKMQRERALAEPGLPSSDFDKVLCGPLRLKVYRLLENPGSSLGAKIFSILSASFVLISLAGLILGSMPEFQDKDKEPVHYLRLLEICCMIYFTVEYLARLAVNPHKAEFIRSPLNIIDVLTILPFIIEVFNELQWIRNFRGAMLVVRVMRLARVARILKLARYSTGLRAFGATMRNSVAELSMLGIFLLTGIMLFSTAIYFFERDEPNSKFYSIPAACWWCTITMTTVGYGDIVPVTAGGKCIAALASVCGIITLAFPISMIIERFTESTGWGEDDNQAGNGKKIKKRYVGF